MADVHLSDLLPPYMTHEAWTDLSDAIEKAFADDITPWRDALNQIRSSFLGDRSDGELATYVSNRDLMPESVYATFDAETERQRLNMLGCRLSSVVGSDTATLARFTRNIGQYWYEKGRGNVTDFLAFCTNSNVVMEHLWSQDYKTFTPTHGTPVWQGGKWFPTTHVNLTFTVSELETTDIPSFVRFFYDLANYNVVIHRVLVEYTLRAGDTYHAIGAVNEHEHVVGNFSLVGLPYATVFTGLIASNANIRGTAVAYFEAEALGWPGITTNAYPYNGGLRDAGSATWDSVNDGWDAWTTWDGASIGFITYEHTVVSFGSVLSLTFAEEHYAQGSVVVELSTSTNGTTWSAWGPATSSITASHVKVRWTVTGADPVLFAAHGYFYA